MFQVKPEWVEHQRRRFMRPDWERFMRPDWERYLRPDWRDRKCWSVPPPEPEGDGEGSPCSRKDGGASPTREVRISAEQRAFEVEVAHLRGVPNPKFAHTVPRTPLRTSDSQGHQKSWRRSCGFGSEVPSRPGRKDWGTSEPPHEMLSDLKLDLLRRQLARKYRSDQPRVPAGNPDGGQWTSEGDAGGNVGRNDPRVISDAPPDHFWKPGARLAANDSREEFPADLRENAHVLAEHVKSRQYVLNRVREMAERAKRLGDQFEGLSTAGSFSSLEAANKLVNSTLAQHRAMVDQVARGDLYREEIEAQFRAPTGYEAHVRTTYSQPELRDTYGVRVVIGHDPTSARGYRIITAYPIR